MQLCPCFLALRALHSLHRPSYDLHLPPTPCAGTDAAPDTVNETAPIPDSEVRSVFTGERLFASQGERLAAARSAGASNQSDNPQLYVNDLLAPSFKPDASLDLHGAKDPDFTILHEKPEHRVILLLKAQLMSNKEIAAKTGYTQPWISQVTRQPWFRARLLEMLHEEGEDPIRAILKPAATDSIFNLIDMSQTATSEAVRLGANKEILDRYLGKAVQKVENFDGGKVPSAESVANLDADIAKLEAEIKLKEGKA